MEINIGAIIAKPGNGVWSGDAKFEVVEISQERQTAKLMSLGSGKVHWVALVDIENAVTRNIWTYAEKRMDAYSHAKTYWHVRYREVVPIMYSYSMGDWHYFTDKYGATGKYAEKEIYTKKPIMWRACITTQETRERHTWATSESEARKLFKTDKVVKIAKLAKVPAGKEYC